LPHLWPTSSSSGWPPLITARYFSSCLSDSTSRWTPCPPGRCRRWLQVRLGCIRLSPLYPVRLLHTSLLPRPARRYPRVRIRRSSFERRRDFNPPEQHAAQHTLRPLLTSALRSSCLSTPPVVLLRQQAQISWGNSSRLPCAIARSTPSALDGYGLRNAELARPA
jgi:hypothetical protein